jgi:hypothetical protein
MLPPFCNHAVYSINWLCMKYFFTVLSIQVFLLASNSAHSQQSIVAGDKIPSELKGEFKDDYGIRYTINDSMWIQHPNIKYQVISWNNAGQYLLARNDKNNPSEKGLYTRIDYMSFINMEPFHWGFCLTVYDAKNLEEAKSKPAADRGNAKKGCGGFPFSRMKRL